MGGPSARMLQSCSGHREGAKRATLRGGAAAGKPGGALGEKQLERLFGKQYTLELTVPHNKATLVKLIKEHRLGGGEFNVVTLDGNEFHIPGTKGGTDAGPSSHFSDMGKGAGKSAKGERKDTSGDKVGAARRALSAATEYRGVTYTEAELRKMPKAEAEYRRELMARSKQEVKMEMGFEGGLKAGLDVYKSVMQKFGGDDKEDAAPSAADWEEKLPKRGVIQFRFKAKELQVTGSAGPAAPERAAWAAQRSAAMNRARGVAAEESAQSKPMSLSDRINEVISIRFVVKKAVAVVVSMASMALSIVAWAWDTIRALLGSSPSADSLRAARAAALS